MKSADRYYKYVEWSEEDNCYIGSCPELMGQACHGDSQIKVFKELCQIVEEWIEICKKDGKPLQYHESTLIQNQLKVESLQTTRA